MAVCVPIASGGGVFAEGALHAVEPLQTREFNWIVWGMILDMLCLKVYFEAVGHFMVTFPTSALFRR